MSSTPLLPAFVAGVCCAAAVGVAVWPTFSAPLERERSSALLEAAGLRERLLTQDRRVQELQTLHDTHDGACAQRISGAVLSAVEKAQADAARDAAAELAEEVARHRREVEEASASCDALMAHASNETTVVDEAPVLTTRSDDCAASVQVLGVGSAAAKWVRTVAPEGAPLAGAADELVISYHGRAGNRTLGAGERVVRPLGGRAPGPVAGWDVALRSMRVGEVSTFVFAVDGEASSTEDELPTYEVELHKLTPVEDLSRAADRSVLKTVLQRGIGSETPADGAVVRVDLSILGQETAVHTHAHAEGLAESGGAADLTAPSNHTPTNDSTTNASALWSSFEFVLGDVDVGGEGLRLLLLSMTRAEVARALIDPSLLRPPLTATGTGVEATAGPVVLSVRLRSFQQERAVQVHSRLESQHLPSRPPSRPPSMCCACACTACGPPPPSTATLLNRPGATILHHPAARRPPLCSVHELDRAARAH